MEVPCLKQKKVPLMANCSTPSLSANTQMKLFSEYSYSHNDMKDSSVFILFIQKIFPMPPPTAQAARHGPLRTAHGFQRSTLRGFEKWSQPSEDFSASMWAAGFRGQSEKRNQPSQHFADQHGPLRTAQVVFRGQPWKGLKNEVNLHRIFLFRGASERKWLSPQLKMVKARSPGACSYILNLKPSWCSTPCQGCFIHVWVHCDNHCACCACLGSRISWTCWEGSWRRAFL